MLSRGLCDLHRPGSGLDGDLQLEALTTGVISDSRATVEMIKVFEVNHIVYREYFEVDLRAINGMDFW